jgi:hypothetical protein
MKIIYNQIITFANKILQVILKIYYQKCMINKNSLTLGEIQFKC